MNETSARLPVHDYEGRYEIDLMGNIYAMFSHSKYQAGRMLKHRVHKQGYLTVVLAKDNKGKSHFIHRLLMLAFSPVSNSDDLDVNHIDGNKKNNSLDNLEWLTPQANTRHARLVLNAWGERQVRGERVAGSKLTADKVREIRRLRESGMTYKSIGQRFGINLASVHKITSRQTWAHIE
jgi:hypothetical protein